MALTVCLTVCLPGTVAPTAHAQTSVALHLVLPHRLAPQLGRGAQGDQTLVTGVPDGRGGHGQLLVRERPTGGAWGADQPLTPSSRGLSAPTLAVAPNGAAVLAWGTGPGGAASGQRFAIGMRIVAMPTAQLLRAALAAAGTAVTLLPLSGCAAFTDQAPGSTAARPQVIAALYPLEFVTQRVAGDHADVVDLTRPGAEPHDLELSIAQTARVTDADLVVYEHGLQPAVDDAVGQAGGATVDAAGEVGLEPFSHDGHDDAAHDVGSVLGGEGDASGDLGDLDPHFWQDPLKMVALADAVADALARVDPGHAADYRANATQLDGQLRTLDKEYADGLTGCARDTVVVSHNAFGYLGRYGLYVEPISGLSPDAEPTPADLARLQQLIASDGITTVFGERLVSPRIAESLAHDMGVATRVLDPIEGLTDQTSDQDYLSLMRENLHALQVADGCPGA